MGLSERIITTPEIYLGTLKPENPVFFFSPAILQETANLFLDGFPGLVTYAVKSNPSEAVLVNLVSAGLRGFDVASVEEIQQIRAISSEVALHFNNPVRSRSEITASLGYNIASYSVDCATELEKLIEIVPSDGIEIAVRFKLPVAGAAYNFGSKFGADPKTAVNLLNRVVESGFIPALTFHPGTQCTSPDAWVRYIEAAAEIAREAGVKIARLNVGGGFPSYRVSCERPELGRIFEAIGDTTARVFGDDAPALICEPGRAMVAESYTLAAQVKAVRPDGSVFLNDGIYGALAELPSIGAIDRISVVDPAGDIRTGAAIGRTVFGPTCDSIDCLPGATPLPEDIAEGDYVLFEGLGAYSVPTATRFNGFGDHRIVTVDRFQ